MGIFRLYTGEDGQSHLEELTLASHSGLTEPAATSQASRFANHRRVDLSIGIMRRDASTSSPCQGKLKLV